MLLEIGRLQHREQREDQIGEKHRAPDREENAGRQFGRARAFLCPRADRFAQPKRRKQRDEKLRKRDDKQANGNLAGHGV